MASKLATARFSKERDRKTGFIVHVVDIAIGGKGMRSITREAAVMLRNRLDDLLGKIDLSKVSRREEGGRFKNLGTRFRRRTVIEADDGRMMAVSTIGPIEHIGVPYLNSDGILEGESRAKVTVQDFYETRMHKLIRQPSGRVDDVLSWELVLPEGVRLHSKFTPKVSSFTDNDDAQADAMHEQHVTDAMRWFDQVSRDAGATWNDYGLDRTNGVDNEKISWTKARAVIETDPSAFTEDELRDIAGLPPRKP